MQNAFKTLISGILETVKSYKGDWNESDASSPNHIKNRTHYTHEGEIVLFDFDDVYEGYYYDVSEPFDLEKEYIIIVDGEKYNCAVCYDEYDELYYIGAPYDYDNDIFDFSEYPFYLYLDAYGFHPYFNDVATFDTEYYGTPHTVRISRIGEIVETIDKKFLPENLGEVVADALPGGVGYIVPEGTKLVDTVPGDGWNELSKKSFLVPDWYYYVNYEGYYKGYVQAYIEDGAIVLGDLDQYGFMLLDFGEGVFGQFYEGGLHFSVRTDDDLPLKIDSQFLPAVSDKSEKLLIQFNQGPASLTSNGAMLFFKEFKTYDEIKTAAEKGNIALVFSDGYIINPTSVSFGGDEGEDLFINLIIYINNALYYVSLWHYNSNERNYMSVNNIHRFTQTA